jgi:chorismate mutase
MSDDPVSRFRAEITAIDREILDAVNRRLDVVAQLKRHKAEHGVAFVDPNREQAMVEERIAENGGPLSEVGLRAFYAELLALTKRELD